MTTSSEQAVRGRRLRDVGGVRKTFEAENAPVRALRGVDLTSRRASSSR